MPGIKEIKNKIEGVQETQKITSAMYLIASNKLRKARARLEQTQPYFRALRGEIATMFANLERVNSIYFLPEGVTEDEDIPIPGKYAYLVITADKGLAGEYNQRVIREAERLLSQHEENALFVVGANGRHYFASHGYEIEKSFIYSAQNPDMDRARDICDQIVTRYTDGEFKKIFLIYTDFGNGMSPSCVSCRLLPFHRAYFDEIPGASETNFDFTPSVDEVLDNIIPNYLIGYVYSALIDSFCSEQNARMMAMDNANRNAGELLEELRLEYNHARQSAITQEIIEISSGAKAMHK